MQIVKASSELLPIIKDQKGILKMIEIAGRTCYKSEDKITEDSATKFVQGTIFKRGHESVVEHGAIVVKVDIDTYKAMKDIMPSYQLSSYNPNRKHFNMTYSTNGYIISGNVRAWRDMFRNKSHNNSHHLMGLLNFYVSTKFKELFDDLYFTETIPGCKNAYTPLLVVGPNAEPCPEDPIFRNRYRIITDFRGFSLQEQLAHIYRSAKFITNRGVGNEFVRNRDVINGEVYEFDMSISQESTRYVNYVTRDDYSGDLKFTDPRLGMLLNKKMEKLSDKQRLDIFNEWKINAKQSEIGYNEMVALGATPEIARGVLLIDLNTEFIMSTNMQGWDYFLRQRTASVAHPQARESAIPILLSLQEEYDFMKEIKPEQRDIDIIKNFII